MKKKNTATVSIAIERGGHTKIKACKSGDLEAAIIGAIKKVLDNNPDAIKSFSDRFHKETVREFAIL